MGLDPVLSLNKGVLCSAALPTPSVFGTEEAHKEGRPNDPPFTAPPSTTLISWQPQFKQVICRSETICVYYSKRREGDLCKNKSVVAFQPRLVPRSVGWALEGCRISL